MLKTPRRMFLDVETTGPRARHDYLLEVAAIAIDEADPDEDLRACGEYRAIIGLPEVEYEAAVKLDNVREMHAASGLRTSVLAAYKSDPMPYHYRVLNVAQELLRFAQNHGYEEGAVVLAGHSVHFDRGFVEVELRAFAPMLHHRLCDVGAIRDFLAGCGVSESVIPARPDMPHRALQDCRLELQEAKQLMAAVKRQAWCPQSMVPTAFVQR